MALTIQTNAKQCNKDFQDFGYFIKGIDDTDQNLDKFTPYIPGISRIWLYKKPHFMNLLFPAKTRAFKTFIESGQTEVSGINDLQVEMVDYNGGFANQTFRAVSAVSDSTNEITTNMYELSGSPIREYLDTWITGVRDPRSGVAHYHGALSNACRYGEINHTCEFIFADYDPTAQELEYGAMFAHGFPQNVPKGHLNYSSGERGQVQMSINWAVSKYESAAINQVCNYYTLHSQVDWNYLHFDPHITEADVKAQAISYGYGK